MAKISHISLYDLELVCDFYNRLKGTIFCSLCPTKGGVHVLQKAEVSKREAVQSHESPSASQKSSSRAFLLGIREFCGQSRMCQGENKQERPNSLWKEIFLVKL